MSMTLSETDKIYKKSFHHRNDSGELDVFEAARYFSGYNDAQKILREDHRQAWRGGRISLDVPMRDSVLQQLPQHHANAISYQKQSHNTIEKQILKEKKYKQPSSPGGRLASFLNSLFSQSNSKKKKSKSKTQSMKDEEESPGGRRKRRSSISHFGSSSTTTTYSSSKSLHSSSSSGFRTPPPYAHSLTKSYKDFRSYSDHKLVESLSKHNIGGQALLKPTSLDLDKVKLNNTTYSEKQKTMNWNDRQYSSKEREFRKINEVDDGAESDSSSDLFELQIYDLGIYSSGLPVYETTHMDSIKRGSPISNGAL